MAESGSYGAGPDERGEEYLVVGPRSIELDADQGCSGLGRGSLRRRGQPSGAPRRGVGGGWRLAWPASSSWCWLCKS